MPIRTVSISTYAYVYTYARPILFLQNFAHPVIPEQVHTNNNAAFQCYFLFNIFFIFWIICTVDFKLILLDFAIDFARITMWSQMYGWMDRQMDRMMDRPTK